MLHRSHNPTGKKMRMYSRWIGEKTLSMARLCRVIKKPHQKIDTCWFAEWKYCGAGGSFGPGSKNKIKINEIC